jgi:hypothetical protein
MLLLVSLDPPFLWHLGKFTDIHRQITMKMTTRALVSSVAIGGAALGLAFGSIDRAQAATLINENFGTGTPGVYNITGDIPGSSFTVTSGNVDLIGASTPYDLYPGNGDFIDLNGSTRGTITSNNSFTFAAGEVANLSFNYGSNPVGSGATADVFLGSTLLASLTAPTGSSFASFNQTIFSPSDGTLRFVSTSGTNGGVVLDNVVLTTVPEPSDLMGTAIAFGSVVLLKRNLTKKKSISK